VSPTDREHSDHLWWDEAPSSTPEEDAIREAAVVAEAARFEKPEPPRTWKRWIPHGVSALSAALVGWLVVRMILMSVSLTVEERPVMAWVYFQIVWLAFGLGLLNLWMWRKR
jgi:hypothetical protein